MNKSRFLDCIAYLAISFIGIPLIIITVTAFGEAPIIQFPIQGFTLTWFSKVFQSQVFMDSFVLSLKISVLATIFCMVIAIPASYALVVNKGKWSERINSIFLAPSLIPSIVLAYALFQYLVIQLHLSLNIALIIGHMLIVFPYTIRIICASLHEFDLSIHEAAVVLGCGQLEGFVKVVLPNIKDALVSASIMGFINSFNNLPVSMFLKGPGMNTLPGALMNHIEYNFDPVVSALSVILMAFTMVLMFVMDKGLSKKGANV
ncbi:ABC transporter permease subunit [Erysipelothrix rhusiopathiae]|nr:ABC transporter permease subunit [Erysipelothrix rhusiopathiae]